MPNSTRQAPHSSAKGVLAVRMLAARLRWLDGRHFWRDGSVAWETADGTFIPEARDLSRAQRCLNKIACFPHAAHIAFGASQTWLAQRRERLELAKKLREIPKADVMLLAQDARRRDPSVAVELSRLLIAEALCLNAMPASPSAALTALGPPGISPILAVLLSDVTPPAARALAALTLGAISRDPNVFEAKLFPSLTDAWQVRAFAWGRSHGLPPHPAFILTLLAESEDAAGRGLRCVDNGGSFSLPVLMLREMLAEGMPPAMVVALAEAAMDAEMVATRLLNIRAELPDTQKQWDRQQVGETLRAERRQAIQELAETVISYARSTGDPQTLRLVTSFFHRMLNLAEHGTLGTAATAAVLGQALEVARLGLKLPPAAQRVYWELLVERHHIFWGPAALVPGQKLNRKDGMLQGWLYKAQRDNISPLRGLLASTQDKATVMGIFELGVQYQLAKQTWTDPDLYRLFVTLADDLDLKRNDYFVWQLCRVLDLFPEAREARPYFQALLQPLRASTPPLRRHVLEALLDETDHTRQAVRQKLPRMIPLLPALVRFASAHESDDCVCGPVFSAALALVESVPEHAKARLEQVLHFLDGPEWHQQDYERTQSLRIGLTLAVSLAANDSGRFQNAVQAATKHRFRQEQDRIRQSLRLLERFPTLRMPLASLFPQQPQRVAELLVRLGLTTRLRTDVQPLLARLEPQAPHDDALGTAFPIFLHSNGSWWNLHRQMPDLTETAAAYLHAQWLRGQSQDVPPGVRRILDRPRKIATEIAHLEGVLAADPDRAGIPARIVKLRALRDDGPRLDEEIHAEVRERLPQVAAETQVAAIELQVLACYRTRLEAVAGPLPPDLVLTDDLVNATLLTVDITQNRKLLLHLLRAHLAGDHGWRERHPANQAFLATLAERGADSGVWLSEFPRRYACAGVPGGRVHLRLERDPMHVLQMGNHFDTCLSFGGINAFSTVANACELNKRVLYARDAAGHVVGRKLIGITAEGELVGFHTYGSLTEETGNQALRNVFRHYAALFAACCGLPMADAGTVPTLFAEAWYDDEAVAWAEDTTKADPLKTDHAGMLPVRQSTLSRYTSQESE